MDAEGTEHDVTTVERGRWDGLLRSVVVTGALQWGVPTAVLVTLFQHAMGDSDPWLLDLGRNLLVFVVTGAAFFGPCMWAWSRSVEAKAQRRARIDAARRGEGAPEHTP